VVGLDAAPCRRSISLGLGDTYDDLRHLPGGRAMWRLGLDHSGTLVGAVLPTRNPVSATIGYLGVLPELRGRGDVDDLIAEALHRAMMRQGRDNPAGETA
jgi:ribosomal protein S18 acetylase RimI-like enzyme